MNERWKDFRAVRLNADNFQHMLQLHKVAFKKNIRESILRYKYASEYLDHKYLGVLIYHDDKPVAFSGVVTVPMTYQGREISGGQLCDGMTHPKYIDRHRIL